MQFLWFDRSKIEMQFGEVRVSNIWIALPGVSGARLETADRPDLVTSHFVKGRPAARLMSLGESKLSSCGPNMVGLFAALVGVHDHFQNQNGTGATLEAGRPCCCWAPVSHARLAGCESLEIININAVT